VFGMDSHGMSRHASEAPRLVRSKERH
jgi:hypothetical protein